MIPFSVYMKNDPSICSSNRWELLKCTLQVEDKRHYNVMPAGCSNTKMLHHPPWWCDSLFPHSPLNDITKMRATWIKAQNIRALYDLEVQIQSLLCHTKEKETILTRWGAGLDLGGGRVNVRVLVAPGSVPSRQPQRLEAQAQVCDTRRRPGWCHLLGARHTTVGEEHPPAAHCSQLRLFWVRDPVQRNK